MKKTIIIIIVLAVVVIAGFMLFNKSDTQPVESLVVVSLLEQNDSGEFGTATISEVDGKVMVSLGLNGAPDFAQPAHIHAGSCSSLGGVEYPLTFPINGTSETTLSLTMNELLSGLPLSINVHKSPSEASVYVACGDIVQ